MRINIISVSEGTTHPRVNYGYVELNQKPYSELTLKLINKRRSTSKGFRNKKLFKEIVELLQKHYILEYPRTKRHANARKNPYPHGQIKKPSNKK